jgi:cysteate synthase
VNPVTAELRHRLRCTACGTEHDDDERYLLSCCDDGLLEAVYPRDMLPRSSGVGLWRFLDWLPVDRVPIDPSAQIGGSTYRSEALAEAVGLEKLWISFNGWWPERGAACPTCSFKDLEVAPTLQRLRECHSVGVVVASAGNTGRSFAHLGGEVGFPVVVVAAADHVERLWRPGLPQAPTTVAVAVEGGDYNDAIDLSTALARELGFEVEGGVRNVARRDGIGTLLLDAVLEMGAMPDHYMQAVGGGPGPIGVGAMARRLRATTPHGRLPRVHLVQNATHAPVHRAWTDRRRYLLPDDLPDGPVVAYADVLVNRAPALGPVGGLYDLLVETDGTTRTVRARAAAQARTLFAAIEGIDIMEAPAVAIAGLVDAVARGDILSEESVLLAITGGGVERRRVEVALEPPDRVVTVARGATAPTVASQVRERLGG